MRPRWAQIFTAARLSSRFYRVEQDHETQNHSYFSAILQVYIATDSQPVDVQSFELSFDVLDVIVDVSCIYGQQGEGELIALDDASASIVTLSDGKALAPLPYSRPYPCPYCTLSPHAPAPPPSPPPPHGPGAGALRSGGPCTAPTCPSEWSIRCGLVINQMLDLWKVTYVC